LFVYAAALTVESIRASARGAKAADAAALPGVFATMHVAFGVGALAECATNGVPVAALLRVLLRLRRHARLEARA
jgi:hypothetical protein